MLRRFSGFLVLVLLTPWLLAVSGAVAPTMPCPMHRESSVHAERSNVHGQTAHGHQLENPSKSGHHGTTSHGCGCAGECGKLRAQFAVGPLAVLQVLSTGSAASFAFEGLCVNVWTADLQPPSTGPPLLLRS